ncbi:GNAT family N-acetyltransferase [Virgibacillus sp. DJP39]|uniref:GNAT family N-acetyltransferase n=1 Tax=Virgibacillus sp. DJP39 TaxID=3409790 RepID=UPI003BB53EAF
MITIKRLSECPLEDVLKAWNLGFEGYFVDLSMTLERFVSRMVTEGFSPELSIVAFDGSKPVGIIKTGIRIINGKKVGWNGGTGVAKDYRNQGVGKHMMDHLLSIYEEQNVEIATLEAIKENEHAIKLYKNMGYVIKDEVANFSLNGPQTIESEVTTKKYSIKKTIPQETGQLPFYKADYTWQTHWKSMSNGEAVIVFGENAEPVGYAYYRRVFDDDFNHQATVLYQCEADPNHNDAYEITKLLIGYVFDDLSADIKRVVVNMPKKGSQLTYGVLLEHSFSVDVEQVCMEKEMNRFFK